MFKNPKSNCSCITLICMHIGALAIIGATIFTLCLMCKEKLAKIFSEMRLCVCNCKDECECTYEEIKDDICDCVCDESEKEADSKN